MQTQEYENFKYDSPIVMPFNYEEELTPAYFEPFVARNISPIKRKRFFRQILDLSKDMHEVRLTHRSIEENVEKVENSLMKCDARLSDTERKISSFKNQVQGLSHSVDPLIIQVSELKAQGLKINELTLSLRANKILIGVLIFTNLILGILVLRPMIF